MTRRDGVGAPSECRIHRTVVGRLVNQDRHIDTQAVRERPPRGDLPLIPGIHPHLDSSHCRVRSAEVSGDAIGLRAVALQRVETRECPGPIRALELEQTQSVGLDLRPDADTVCADREREGIRHVVDHLIRPISLGEFDRSRLERAGVPRHARVRHDDLDQGLVHVGRYSQRLRAVSDGQLVLGAVAEIAIQLGGGHVLDGELVPLHGRQWKAGPREARGGHRRLGPRQRSAIRARVVVAQDQPAVPGREGNVHSREEVAAGIVGVHQPPRACLETLGGESLREPGDVGGVRGQGGLAGSALPDVRTVRGSPALLKLGREEEVNPVAHERAAEREAGL